MGRTGNFSLRISTLILLFLAAAARLCGQAWERLGPEGGMVLSLGVDSARKAKESCSGGTPSCTSH
jgi:hypothetical protein